MRLLVIEDDPDLNRQLVTALGDAGYAVDTAFDGEEGHFLGDTEPYDAVVLHNAPGRFRPITTAIEALIDGAQETLDVINPYVTDRGMIVCKETALANHQAVAQVYAQLPVEDRRHLARILRKLLEVLTAEGPALAGGAAHG